MAVTSLSFSTARRIASTLSSVNRSSSCEAKKQVLQNDSLTGLTDPWVLPDGDVILFAVRGAGVAAGGAAEVNIFALDTRGGEMREITTGATPRYASGHLVFGDPDGTVFAQRFDPDLLELTGEPVRIAQDVGGWLQVSLVMAVSPTGAIAYFESTTGVGRELLVQRDVTTTELVLSRAGLRSPRISPSDDRV